MGEGGGGGIFGGDSQGEYHESYNIDSHVVSWIMLTGMHGSVLVYIGAKTTRSLFIVCDLSWSLLSYYS